ncbi:MAG: VOC family protein [Pedobacter sp.]|nr:MAG: VOC family protein [Pedobacter sp.]
MTTVNVYLTFNGNCEAAFNHYKAVFGGDFNYIGKFKDMPDGEGKPTDPDDLEKVLHVGLSISQETMLMGSDTTKEWHDSFQVGNNMSISITTDSRQEADRLFKGLSENGKVTMPMNDTFWGDYFGMCTDQFGINWMVSFPVQG